jgi:threonylcarbamoyladenosine tRNA methylthiotransferase MtaB
MRRSYRTPAYRRKVLQVASRVSPLALGADLIVGFPGETEADHRKTLEFLADLPFTHLHPFTYSPRPGTSAANLRGRPPGDISRRRLASARALVMEKNRAFRAGLVGSSATVLIEETSEEGWSHGFSEHYVKVVFRSNKNLVGRFALVKVTGLHKDGFSGHMLEAVP